MGHEVEARPSLAKGLEALDQTVYDVVYLDVDLPDGNGLLSIPAITERDKAPEVIIFTGASYPNGAELAIQNGAWDYIEKPATADTMFIGAGVGGLWCDTKVPYNGEQNNVTENAEIGATYSLTQMVSLKGSLKYMARKAAAEGLVVIDDPESILRCSNKVYLAEVLARHRLPAPQTVIVHGRNIDHILEELSLPCVLKQPDSAFSQGVVLVRDKEALEAEARRLLSKSDLVIAQEYLPSDFDWRIGVLDRRPLFACKYFMAAGHWQILRKGKSGKDIYGRVETLPVGKVPKKVITTALKAAGAIGDGLYGVDLKQVGNKVYVIEVNDNPNIDAGFEDEVLQDELYLRVVETFLKRIERRKTGSLNI